MKSYNEFLAESVNFANQMNSNKFRPTNAQMHALIGATKSVVGTDKISVLQLKDVDMHLGKASFTKDGNKYEAYRLKGNDKWYLTGDYETV